MISKIGSNPVTVHPTLIVGLGGTGVLVCLWIEDQLRKMFGRVPPFIRFLKLDLDNIEEGGPTNASRADFVNLLEHMDVGEVVQDFLAHPDYHPHLKWFKGIRLDATAVTKGARGIPRLGRLVFMELRETIIHDAVIRRFGDLRDCAQTGLGPEWDMFSLDPSATPLIVVACSVCGGTGAGMLIDAAYNLRWWSKESFPRAAEVVAHIMLPEAFFLNSEQLRDKLKGVAGATLEQIEFLADPRRDDVSVPYSGQDGREVLAKGTQPFDYTYVVNGQGNMGGNRKHLVKMIARTICAMTVEPTSKPVASDGDNKLNDALSHLDQRCGRRQCFSSYGLHRGVAGHRRTDLEKWIRSTLEDLGKGTSKQHTNYKKEVKAKLASLCDVTVQANKISRPTESFDWQLPSMHQQVDIKASVISYAAKYVSDIVETIIRNGSTQIIDPEKPYRVLLDAVEQMIEQSVFQASELPPISQVGVCLNQWIEQMEFLLGSEIVSKGLLPHSVCRQMLDDVQKKLDDLVRKTYIDSITPEDLNPDLAEVINNHMNNLSIAYLTENLRKAFGETIKVLRARRLTLDHIVSLTRAGMLRDFESTSETGEQADYEKNDDFFTTSVYTASNPMIDPNSTLGRTFRQNLIRPFVQNLIMVTEPDKDGLVDMDRIKRALSEKYEELTEKMNDFLTSAEQEDWVRFHKPIRCDENQVTNHYSPRVRQVYDLASPKVGLDRANRYSKPLETVICQHLPGCCAPVLMNKDTNADYREAHTSQDYVRVTETWLQVLRLYYGFCLEALSNYNAYIRAVSEYFMARRGIDYAGLWLDDQWYEAFQELRSKWKQDRDRIQDGGVLEKTAYDDLAVKIRSIRKSIETGLKYIKNYINEEITNRNQALQAMEEYKDWELQIRSTLADLRPGPLGMVKKTIDRLHNLMKKLLTWKDKTFVELSDQDHQKIANELTKCLDLLGESGLLDKTVNDELAITLRSIHNLIKNGFAFIKNYIDTSITDPKQKQHAMKAFKEWELQVKKTMADLRPGPRDMVKKALYRLDKLMENLLARKDEIFGELSDQDNSEITDNVQQCREQIQKLVENFESK